MRILLTIPTLLLFQITLMSQIYISTQEQIDNFYTDYPYTTLPTSIRISGNDIRNLDSLYRLDSIQGFLMIVNTGLEDVNGLENLTFVESLILEGNVNLKKYEGLSNLESILGSLHISSTKIDTFPLFPNLQMIENLIIYNNPDLVDISNLEHLEFRKITIINNANLSICANNAICNHLASFKEYAIQNNSVGCSNREQILLNCPNYEPCYFDQSSVLLDFNSWNNSNLPAGWKGILDTIEFSDNMLINITQSPPITDTNGYSLNLTTFSDPWGESLEGAIGINAYNPEEFIDISFEYCFQKTPIGQFGGKGSLLVNNKEFWNTGLNYTNEHVNCTNPRKVEICNIPIHQGLDSITISLKNKTLYSDTDGIISSSWIIDDFMINNVGVTSNIEEVNYSTDVVLYPNPTSNSISVRSNTKFSDYKLYDIFSRELAGGHFNDEVDISELRPGVYVLVLQSANYTYSKKISKI